MKQRLLSFMLTLLTGMVAQAQVTINADIFPDDNFRQWVSNTCDTDHDGTLSDSELSAKLINLQNRGIANLQGIEYFTAMTTLNCSQNQLTTLDLSHNTALTRLSCNNNQLTALDVSANTLLTNISCNNNCIQGAAMTAFINSLPTVSSGKLTLVSTVEGEDEQNTYTMDDVTNAAGKGWAAVDTYGNSLLLTVDANHFPDAAFLNYVKDNIDTNHDNILSDMEIAVVSTIDVSGSGITDLKGISYFTELRNLFCQRNALTTLDVSKNRALEVLYCNDNQLTKLSLFTNPALFRIACFNNKIDTYAMGSLINSLRNTRDGASLIAVSTQSWEENARPTNAQIFAANEKNWHVYEAYDEDRESELIATGIYINEKYFPDTGFRSFVASRAIDKDLDGVLSDSELLAVTDIDVHDKSVTDLTGIAFFTELTSLRAFNNKLTTIDLSKNNKLEIVYCQNNKLTGLDLSSCPALQNVTIYDNQIDEAAMDTLFQNLPTVAAEATIVVYSTANTEGNAHCTPMQVKDAKAKHWAVQYYDATAYALKPFQVLLDATNFPDEEFRAYIYNNIDKNHDHVLSDEEIAATTTIKARNYAITDFTGIELFTELTELTTGYKEIRSLDLSKNANLQILDCSNNGLTWINIAGTNINTLYCNRNKLDSDALQRIINDLPVKNGGVLAVYDVANEEGNAMITSAQIEAANAKKWTVYTVGNANELTELKPLTSIEINALNFPDVSFRSYVSLYDTDKDGTLSPEEIERVKEMRCNDREIADLTGIGVFRALKALYCYGNKLTTLDMSKNAALESLSCYGNSLTTLNVTNNRALIHLICYDNQLATLDVTGNSALELLNVYSNKLTALDITKNRQLKELRCESNNFTSDAIESLVSTLPNVPIVYRGEFSIDRNAITPYQVYKAFRQNWTVQYRGTYTYVRTMGYGDVEIDDQKYFPNDKLRTYIKANIDSNSDGILSVDEAEAVTEIDVHGQEINDLFGIGFFRKLTNLYCQDNALTSLDLSYFQSLKRVECYKNKINGGGMDGLFDKLTYSTNKGPVLVPYYTGSGEQNWPVTDEHLMAAKKKSWTVYSYDGTSYTTLHQSEIAIDETNFPDANFRSWVSANCDTDNSGGLSTEERIAKTTINVGSKQIADLTGIGYFTNVTSLSCNNNQLTALDVSQLTSLAALDCSDNQLTALDLSHNTTLTTLNCNSNQLAGLNLGQNVMLTTLKCNMNNFNTLDVRKYPKLKVLECGTNSLTALDVSQNTLLEELNCFNNQLTTLNVLLNTALTKLQCGYNQLTSLDLSRHPALTYLDCEENSFGTIDLSHNPVLETLQCNYCELTAIDLSQNVALTRLDIYENKLESLDLSHNTALRVLRCNGNQLTTLDLSQNKDLEDVYIFRNNINGEGMDALVDNLPTVEAATLHAVMPESDDQNVITKSQVAVARGKHWNVQAYIDISWVDYDGESEGIRGDVNGDGEVGIGDIVAITNVMAGITTDAGILERADVNEDGEVGIGDIVAITNIMAGI